MKKYALAFVLTGTFSRSFADLVNSEPTGDSTVDNALLIGVVAIVILLIIRGVRKRKQL